MWSHYGGEHKGICLGFDLYLKEDIDGKLKDQYFRVIEPVIYTDEYPVINVIEHIKFEQALLNGNLRELAHFTSTLLRSKSSHWSYENEIRGIVSPLNGGPGVRSFPPERLKEVILGARIELDFRKNVTSLISQFPSEIELYESKLSESRFELIYERL